MLKCLCLDVETNSLEPASGQIIELAGVIFELDEASFEVTIISQFESLIKLRADFNDKITFITGITAEDLADAPDNYKVFEAWHQWIDQFGEGLQIITGHSVGFDLGFLKYEEVYLPDKITVVDTMDLSRLLLPQSEALNLEFLTDFLGLQDFSSPYTHHRALYDVLVNVNLLSKLLGLTVKYRLPQFILDYISGHLLNNLLLFYGSDDKMQPHTTPQTPKPILHLRSTGKPEYKPVQESLTEMISQNIELYQDLWSQILIPKLQYYLVQAYIYSHLHGLGMGPTKLHFVPDNYQFEFYQDITILAGQLLPVEYDSAVISPIESIVWQVDEIATHKVNLEELVWRLDVILQLLPLESDNIHNLKQLNVEISKVIADYDFLFIKARPLTTTGRTQVFSHSSDLQAHEFLYKLNQFLLSFQNLLDTLKELELENIYTRFVLSQLDKILMLIPHKLDKFDLYISGQQVCISFLKKAFSLPEYYTGVLATYPHLQIETRLQDPLLLQQLAQVTGLDDSSWRLAGESPQIIVEQLDSDRVAFDRIYQYILSHPDGLYLFSNLNHLSKFKDLYKTFFAQNSDKVLVLGESGSYTKLMSKLKLDPYRHLFAPTYQYARYLMGNPDWSQIVIVGEPYYRIPQYFHKDQFRPQQPYLKSIYKSFVYTDITTKTGKTPLVLSYN